MKPPVKWLSWEPYNMLKEVIVNKIESQIAFNVNDSMSRRCERDRNVSTSHTHLRLVSMLLYKTVSF